MFFGSVGEWGVSGRRSGELKVEVGLRFKFWLGVLISAVFLYFFARQLDWLEVWRIIKSINYFYLPLFFLVHMLAFWFRAQRWHYLLLPLKKIRVPVVFEMVIIGFMGNNIFPARLGEIIRVYVLARRERISKSATMATIILERLMDGFSIIILLVGLFWFFPFPPGFEQNEIVNPRNLKIFGGVSGAVYLLIIFFLVSLKLYSASLLGWLERIMRPRFARAYEKLAGATDSFISGLEGLKRGRHLLAIAVYAVLVWLAVAAAFYTLYPAFKIQLPFSSTILLVVVIALAVAAPSSPGYVGTFHFACAASLMLLGVEPNTAKSFAIVVHGMMFIPVTLMGIFFVYRENLNLKELHDLESEVS